MESSNVSNITNAFEIHMEELKRFREKYPKEFNVESTVLPKSSFSRLSSNDRKELSTIYFNLAEAIIRENDAMTEMTEEDRLRALDYLNSSINSDFRRNKGVYSKIAKLYAANKNQVGAYVNALIAVELGKMSRDDEFFVEQCKKMPFPTPRGIMRINDMTIESIDFLVLLLTDLVLILEPGTYTINFPIGMKKNVVIIGIGEVTIKGPLMGDECNFMLYNVCVEYIEGHSLSFRMSNVCVSNCQFTKCCQSNAPICINSRSSLFMNECLVANSEDAGGILLDTDSRANIKSCEIRNIGMGAIEVRYGSSLIAMKNHIHHNRQGVIAWLDTNEVRLIDNIIQENSAEGILIHGNREPPLSRKINAEDYDYYRSCQFTYEPPPSLSYTRPSQTVAKIQNNKILKNGSFGVSADCQSNVRMEENEIANNGSCGCIIKGGVDASLSNNNIHHNRSHGIEIGMNYNGNVVVENNYIHANKEENIVEVARQESTEIIARRYGVNKNQLSIPAKLINNKFENYESNEQDFVNFNVSSNRPGLHLFYEEQPYLYAIGNTYGFNLLKESHEAISKTISYDTYYNQNVKSKQLSVFLGGVGDLRNIVETVHGVVENHTENCNIDLLFTINDFNPVILARDLVLLKMISELPDPSPSSPEDLENPYSKWSKDFVAGAIQILSVWAEKTLKTNAFRVVNDCINSLIESLEIIVSNKSHITKEPPSWISFKYSQSTAYSILQILKCWKENSYTSTAINWKNNVFRPMKEILEVEKYMPASDVNILKNLMKKYSNTDDEIEKYNNYRFPISTQVLSYDQERKDMYSETKRYEFNLTMFTVPTMEDIVYPYSCIFRAFQVDSDLSQYEDRQLILYDHLLLTLLPKFASLRSSFLKNSSIKIQVIPILGDIIDTLLCRLPSTVRFNAVDCSNIADYTSLINILLAAAHRLKDNSLLTSQLMKLCEEPSKPIEKFIEDRLGISLDAFARLTGIKLVDSYYQDYAVYATWKFGITRKDEDKEEEPETLMKDVIMIACACCVEHANRIKGLSINILVRLFQIMIARFSENTMTQLLQLLFSLEGFNKYIPNFAIHLIELKTFMILHLPRSLVLKIEEFKDFKKGPIARFNVTWMTNKLDNGEKEFRSVIKLLKREGLHSGRMINSEAEIWLRLTKPTSKGNARKQKKKGSRSNNTTEKREPTYYYLDSVSLNAVNSPVITVSFHLPISFYDTHKDWILECIIGPVKILDATMKFTLSKAKQEDLYHDTWVGISRSEVNDGSENNESENDGSGNENNKENLSCKQCKQRGKTKKSTGGVCSKCKSAFYCSKDCQKKGWKKHKIECVNASNNSNVM